MKAARLYVSALAFALVVAGSAQGQAAAEPSPEELRRTIKALDAKVFDAFNQCDLKAYGSYFNESIEFYHDNGGLTDTTRESVVESVKKYICGKARRELVESSLEVFPMHGFGAVETGVHRFTHPGHDDTEDVGEARFLILWQFKDGDWKITRVVSYDHHPLKK
jgi:hypothetical protein